MIPEPPVNSWQRERCYVPFPKAQGTILLYYLQDLAVAGGPQGS